METSKQKLLREILACKHQIFGLVVAIKNEHGGIVDVECLILQNRIKNSLKRKAKYLELLLNDQNEYPQNKAVITHWFYCAYDEVGEFMDKTFKDLKGI